MRSKILKFLFLVVFTLCVCIPIRFLLLSQTVVFNYAPSWSPNGNYIVYSCFKPPGLELVKRFLDPRGWGDFPYDPHFVEICTIGKDGAGRKQLTNNRAEEDQPRWSPNGKEITYVSHHDGMSYITSMNIENSELQELYASSDLITSFSWAPNSAKITFSDLYQGNLYILDIDTQKAEIIEEKNVIGPTVWSPDGRKLAYPKEDATDICHVHIFDLETREKVILPEVTVCISSPAWDPGGVQVAYVGFEASNIYVYNFTEGQITSSLQSGVETLNGLVWLKDGKSILSTGEGKLFKISVIDGAWKELLDYPGETSISILGGETIPLSLDGTEILFVKVNEKYSISEIWKLRLVDLFVVKID